MFVFFFKHKTAYEMRISDWSSDVCSSDLYVNARSELAGEFRHGVEQVRDEADVGDLEDRGVLVLVDGDDGLGVLHPGEVLDRARDADRNVDRSEERRVGKECVSTCRSRWSLYH